VIHAISTPLPPSRIRAIRRRLLAWYEANESPFPWRTARDPYSALVAAVAAQQTQIARVLEIHERWMAAFPTLGDLARADRAEVLRVWGRAGYPRRAVALHEVAMRCVRPAAEGGYGGALPRDPEALLALPGVGPFTAAIVRTFGWGEDVPAVDTNVVRVLGRLVHGDLQPAKETRAADIAATAARLLPRGEAARWNPALMDYGARVCLPRPRCEGCVLASVCAARPRFAAGEVAEPVRAQGRFEGSDRQARGRLLAALREAHASDGAGLRESTLLRRLDPGGEERERLRRLLGDLVAEGLAWRSAGRAGGRSGTRWGLGTAGVSGAAPPPLAAPRE